MSISRPGSATLMDAFNAGTSAARQFMRPVTDEWRRENELYAGRVSGEVFTAVQDRLSRHPFNYQGDPDDKDALEVYRREWQGELDEFTDSLYGTALKNNTSKHFRELIERQQIEAKEKNRNTALGKENEWRMGYARDRFNRNIQGYMETMDPKSAWEHFQIELEILGGTQEITPETREKFSNNYARALHERYAANTINAVTANISNPQELTAAMSAARSNVRETFAAFMPGIDYDVHEERDVLDEEGNVTGTERVTRRETRAWSYEGMKEAEEKLVHDRHFGIMSEMEGLFQRIKASDSGNYERTINFGSLWRDYHDRTYNPNNDEHAFSNSTYRPRMDGFFNHRMVESALRSTGGRGGRYGLRPSDVDPDRWVHAIVSGDFAVLLNLETGQTTGQLRNHREALASYLYYYEDAWRGQFDDPFGEEANRAWANEQENQIRRYEERMKSIIKSKEGGDALWSLYEKLSNADVYNNQRNRNGSRNDFYISDSNSVLRNIEIECRDKFIEDLMAFATDLLWSGVSHNEMETRMKSYILGHIDPAQSGITINSNDPNDPEIIDRLAAYSLASLGAEKRDSTKDAVWSKTKTRDIRSLTATVLSDDDIVWRRESAKETFNAVREHELGWLMSMMELPASMKDSIRRGIMLSGDNEADPILKGTFTIESGDHAGTYRVSYDEKNRNNPFVEKMAEDRSWVQTDFYMGRRPAPIPATPHTPGKSHVPGNIGGRPANWPRTGGG